MVRKLLLAAVGVGALWAGAAEATIYAVVTNTQGAQYNIVDVPFGFPAGSGITFQAMALGGSGTSSFTVTVSGLVSPDPRGCIAPAGSNYCNTPSIQFSEKQTFTVSNGLGFYNLDTGILRGITAGDVLSISQASGASASITFTNVAAQPTSPASVVPEPTSWAMFIGGFGIIGAALRRCGSSVLRPLLD